MSEQDDAKKLEAKVLRDTFQGIKGREPTTNRELEEWLASPEGKAATAFVATDASRWGEIGRS